MWWKLAIACISVWMIVGPLLRETEPDERSIAHRYRSLRLAMIVGVVLALGLFVYEWGEDGRLSWDLLVVLGAMGLTKAAVMVYMRVTEQTDGC